MSPLHSTKYLVAVIVDVVGLKPWKRAWWLLLTTCHNYVRSGFQSFTCCPVVQMQCGSDGASVFCRKHAALRLRSGSTTCLNSTIQGNGLDGSPTRSLLVHICSLSASGAGRAARTKPARNSSAGSGAGGPSLSTHESVQGSSRRSSRPVAGWLTTSYERGLAS